MKEHTDTWDYFIPVWELELIWLLLLMLKWWKYLPFDKVQTSKNTEPKPKKSEKMKIDYAFDKLEIFFPLHVQKSLSRSGVPSSGYERLKHITMRYLPFYFSNPVSFHCPSTPPDWEWYTVWLVEMIVTVLDLLKLLFKRFVNTASHPFL